ncbi:hypothetical protein GH714_027683 [Hevea brasiliensis]|uniref:Uncharacterized protein n=1 Tax=Hevea brasiliensis TaxID=3981 RepID=A0A6A6MHW3_HEVBR|nr:hypothetical protein GH714_027683 [Hevea brasiliensis]
MEIKEAERVVIAKPVASRPTCSNFRSFSELLEGSINGSPPNVCSETTVAAIRPKTVRFKPMVSRAPAASVSSQADLSGTALFSSSDKVSNPDSKPLLYINHRPSLYRRQPFLFWQIWDARARNCVRWQWSRYEHPIMNNHLNDRNEGSEGRVEDQNETGLPVHSTYQGKAPPSHDPVGIGSINAGVVTSDNSCGLSGECDEGSKGMDGDDDEPKAKRRKNDNQSNEAGVSGKGAQAQEPCLGAKF